MKASVWEEPLGGAGSRPWVRASSPIRGQEAAYLLWADGGRALGSLQCLLLPEPRLAEAPWCVAALVGEG